MGRFRPYELQALLDDIRETNRQRTIAKAKTRK